MTSDRIIIIQNHPIESLETFERYLKVSDADYDIHYAYRNVDFEIKHYAALIVGGSPTSVYDREKPEFFSKEIDYLREAVRRGTPCLGVCGGGQLLANILGAQVKRNPIQEIGA